MTDKEYFLMHKDIVVCSMQINDSGDIGKIRRIASSQNHFPIGGQMNDSKFHEWWRDRAIPKTRHGANSALEKLGYATTGNILIDNLALSLTDCYWIKPREINISWADINLFKNDFVDSFGELTINEDADILSLNNATKFSPATSQGELQKKWCISNDKRRYLVKGNYGQSYQQSLNEVFASNLLKRLNYPLFANYDLINIQTSSNTNALGCFSYNFCNEDVEMISAWEILQKEKLPSGSYYHPFKKACLELGMNEDVFNKYIDFMIVFDFLISNTDRHMNNIAILRNPDTLELLGFAPLFDFGNSMFYQYSLEELNKINIYKIKTHGFISWEIDSLKYVTNRKCLDINLIKPDFSIYTKDIKEQQSRYSVIKKLFEKKLLLLDEFQNGENIWNKRK